MSIYEKYPELKLDGLEENKSIVIKKHLIDFHIFTMEIIEIENKDKVSYIYTFYTIKEYNYYNIKERKKDIGKQYTDNFITMDISIEEAIKRYIEYREKL